MGMPARVELIGSTDPKDIESIFSLWDEIDERFSTYKDSSEIMRIRRNEIDHAAYSADMREILALAKKTHLESAGYFDIKRPDGFVDPSGIVKGWAIQKAAMRARELGFSSYYLEIGGDIQTNGYDASGQEWRIGIRNPFDHSQIIKILYPHGLGVATSGSAARGAHIYNPHHPEVVPADMVSITVIGPNIYEADRFATAAFAMGRDGIFFIEALAGFEAYAIDHSGLATMTSGVGAYL